MYLSPSPSSSLSLSLSLRQVLAPSCFWGAPLLFPRGVSGSKQNPTSPTHPVQVCGAWSSLAPNGIWSGSWSAAIMHADGTAWKGGVQDGPDNADPARRVLDEGGLGQLSMTWAPSTCVRSGTAYEADKQNVRGWGAAKKAFVRIGQVGVDGCPPP